MPCSLSERSTRYDHRRCLLEHHNKLTHALALSPQSGEGVDIDFALAVDYYNRSAALGNAAAQRSLAFMYDTGKGVPTNKAMAILYYTFAARNFDTEASHVLAYKHQYGINVHKSCVLSAEHYKAVALKGSWPLALALAFALVF
mgnify:CR=1 FL=1